MKTMLKTLMIGVATSALLAGAASAEKIIIGHFGNPTPMQLLSTMDALEQETGWEIEWRKFAAGTDVIAAMASGDVVLSELGSSPLAIAASQGVDLQLIAFSDVIGTAESLIAHNDSGITSVADLKGKRVAHVSPSSNSGDAAPRALFSSMGVVPGKDYEVLFSGKHDNSILGVANKDYDAAAIANSVMNRMIIRKVVDGSKLRSGEPVAGLSRILQAHRVDAVLANCSVPESMSAALLVLKTLGRLR